MSMSVRCEGCGLEYAGARGRAGLFAQRATTVNPRYLRMLTEVKHFHRQAKSTTWPPGTPWPTSCPSTSTDSACPTTTVFSTSVVSS